MVMNLRVERLATLPGPAAWVPIADHRVKLHAGPPVRGTCRMRDFVTRRGEIDIVPAGMSDAWEEHDASSTLTLHLPHALLRRAAQEMRLPEGRAALAPRHQFRDARIEHIAWALDADRLAGSPSGRLFADSLGVALAVHLLGHSAATARREPAPLSPQQLRRVVEHIDAHVAADLSLARLAEVVGISASHLKTVFKRSTGVPVHQFVVQRRVERAVSLLRGGEMPASEVALEAGFAHQSHMARWMRRLLGVTPTRVSQGA